jgi:hypothetical protein
MKIQTSAIRSRNRTPIAFGNSRKGFDGGGLFSSLNLA